MLNLTHGTQKVLRSPNKGIAKTPGQREKLQKIFYEFSPSYTVISSYKGLKASHHLISSSPPVKTEAPCSLQKHRISRSQPNHSNFNKLSSAVGDRESMRTYREKTPTMKENSPTTERIFQRYWLIMMLRFLLVSLDIVSFLSPQLLACLSQSASFHWCKRLFIL